MAKSITTFLMFTGQAQEAMNFYVSLFNNSSVDSTELYGAEEMGGEGSVKLAEFTLAGRDFMCFDTPVEHGFGMTPAISISVECEDDAEIERLSASLSAGGRELIPLGVYDGDARFAWVQDKFGVSWQLNLL